MVTAIGYATLGNTLAVDVFIKLKCMYYFLLKKKHACQKGFLF